MCVLTVFRALKRVYGHQFPGGMCIRFYIQDGENGQIMHENLII